MKTTHWPRGALLAMALAGCGAAAQPRASAGELESALASARARGCPGHPGTQAPLRWAPELARAARLVAQGEPAQDAVRRSGYRATRVFQAHLSGHASAASVLQAMQRHHCAQLTDASLRDGGLYRDGRSWWILLARPFDPPPASAAAEVAAQVLAHSNEARSRGQRCGGKFFPAAGPLRQDARLAAAASRHAQDMARHGVLRHEGSDGSSPGERATQAGYRWRSIGENVAAGQTTARQVVQEWLRSPQHCAALMGPEFTQMGVAYAVDMNSEGGIYWSQALAQPQPR